MAQKCQKRPLSPPYRNKQAISNTELKINVKTAILTKTSAKRVKPALVDMTILEKYMIKTT